MSDIWQKKLFRLSTNDMSRLDSLVESLGEKLEAEQIKKPSRTLVLRALIMLGTETDESELIKQIKEAKIYI
jgi:hypothetical protein